MQSRSLPLTYIDVNSNLFKVTTGIKLSSGNNTYRKSVQSVYILEEYREGVWRHVLCCDIHDKEESRRELVKHICHAYKAKLTDSSDTLRKGQQIDSINAEINDIEEEIGITEKSKKSKPFIALKKVSEDNFTLDESLKNKIVDIYT